MQQATCGHEPPIFKKKKKKVPEKERKKGEGGCIVISQAAIRGFCWCAFPPASRRMGHPSLPARLLFLSASSELSCTAAPPFRSVAPLSPTPSRHVKAPLQKSSTRRRGGRRGGKKEKRKKKKKKKVFPPSKGCQSLSRTAGSGKSQAVHTSRACPSVIGRWEERGGGGGGGEGKKRERKKKVEGKVSRLPDSLRALGFFFDMEAVWRGERDGAGKANCTQRLRYLTCRTVMWIHMMMVTNRWTSLLSRY